MPGTVPNTGLVIPGNGVIPVPNRTKSKSGIQSWHIEKMAKIEILKSDLRTCLIKPHKHSILNVRPTIIDGR